VKRKSTLPSQITTKGENEKRKLKSAQQLNQRRCKENQRCHRKFTCHCKLQQKEQMRIAN